MKAMTPRYPLINKTKTLANTLMTVPKMRKASSMKKNAKAFWHGFNSVLGVWPYGLLFLAGFIVRGLL